MTFSNVYCFISTIVNYNKKKTLKKNKESQKVTFSDFY